MAAITSVFASTPRTTGIHLPQRSRASAPRAVRHTVRASAVTDELNSKFGIDGSIAFSDGKGDLPMVTLTHASGATAELYLFGGCVTSWVVDGKDQLYVRPDAKFNGEKPISGGIPHCFPQFGPGEIQQHGFARNMNWEVAATSADVNPDDPEPCIELQLSETEYSKGIWDRPFNVVYQIALKKDTLVCDYRVVNTGSEAFDFTAALHTYFSAAGAASVKVAGLKGLSYLDKTVDANAPPTKSEEREAVTIEGPVDSVYLKSGEEVTLETAQTKIDIQSNGWTDTVVWNPWNDMPACYDEFVCVECAQVSEAVTLPAGESWLSTMTLVSN